MAQRGRVPAVALESVNHSGIQAERRPEPPVDLTPEQAAEWLEVTERTPADWFPRSTWPLLAQYCRHVVAARKVGSLIESHEAGSDLDLDVYDRLLKMQEREGRALSSLATRMRISQQSTYDARKSKAGKNPVNRPWD